jgi:hypothetical protein
MLANCTWVALSSGRGYIEQLIAARKFVIYIQPRRYILKSKRVLIALILVWLLFLGISTAANPTNDFEAVKWRSFYPGEVQHIERSYKNDPTILITQSRNLKDLSYLYFILFKFS